MAGFRHNQIRPQSVSLEGFGVRFSLGLGEVCEGNRRAGRTGETSVGVGYGQSVACFVLPGLEMHGFAGADAQQDAQDFEICYLLGKRGVQTGSSHFDESKVKACGESNRLEMGGDAFGVIAAEAATVCVRIRSGDGGVLLHMQAWHGLNKWRTGIKIRVSDAAIPRPEAGVDGQLHEVGEALFPGGTGGRASRNRGKVAQVHGLGTLRFQEIVQKLMVAELIIRVS